LTYVTEEQRSRPGWIGGQNVPEILNGGTRAWTRFVPPPRFSSGYGQQKLFVMSPMAMVTHGAASMVMVHT
jgi:hypothetical protein